MNFKQYQEAACDTAINNSMDHLGFGLVEEAGEVAGIFKRYHRGDDLYRSDRGWGHITELSLYAKDKLKAELGDVLWHIAVLADSFGFDLEDVARANLDKLQRRRANNTVMGSGDDR